MPGFYKRKKTLNYPLTLILHEYFHTLMVNIFLITDMSVNLFHMSGYVSYISEIWTAHAWTIHSTAHKTL